MEISTVALKRKMINLQNTLEIRNSKLEILNYLWYFKNSHNDERTWCDAENTTKSRIDYIFAKYVNLNQI